MSTPWVTDVLAAEIERLLKELAASDARGDILAQELAKANIARDAANGRADLAVRAMTEAQNAYLNLVQKQVETKTRENDAKAEYIWSDIDP